MLPLTLLKASQKFAVLVELKNGETYNGHMANCDTWMNIHLKEVICTSKDGDRFWRMPEAYIRGNTIKYVRIPEEVLENVQEESTKREDKKPAARGRGRGWSVGGRDGGRGGDGEVGRGGRGGRQGRGGRGGRQ